MTGLEATAAASGARLLASVASPAARALARKTTFRRTACRRVRKRVEWPCRWRTYRKWLKTLTAEELAAPVEEIQAHLAARLDTMLATASTAWVESPEHLSRALRLVELTYPAIAAGLGDADRTAICESWAQQRSVKVRELLLQLAGPAAALSSPDLACALEARSRARRAVRLQPYELDEDTRAQHFAHVEIVQVPAGEVRVLLSDFGSGKSEIGEAWHRACIADLAAHESAPFPVWCNARDLIAESLEAAVERQVGAAWRHGRGAAIVVDGADEADPSTAQALLEAARTTVRTFTNVCVLVTARPGVLAPTDAEVLTAPLLADDKAESLVELAGGRAHDTWQWTANMRTTVARPFFALAAGAMLARDETPRGEADLIRGLVEDALKNGKQRVAVTSTETRSVLTAMAVALTRTGADGLSFGDRQIARSSRLVTDAVDGTARFSLPIFQHWFAAQALLSGDVPADEIMVDATSFSRWRWAAAVAALSANGPDAVDDLLTAWVAGNPGAAAWILKTAFAGHRDWRAPDDKALDPTTSGTRLLRALRTWVDALAGLAAGTVPWPVVAGPVELGVAVSGTRIDVGFARSAPAADLVTELPQGVHPLAGDSTAGWSAWISGGAPEGDVWPWTMVRDRVASATIERLSWDHRLGASDGVWVAEHRFDLSRRLLNLGSLFHQPLPAERVRSQAVKILDAVGGARNARIVLNGRKIGGSDLDDLVRWIDDSAAEHVETHLPAADIERPTGGWIWDLFSPQRLMEFEAEVYGRACDAYDEAVAHAFARLSWSMPGAALAPFGVVMEFTSASGDQPPGLSLTRVPMALLPQFAAEREPAFRSASGRAIIACAEPEPSADRFPAILGQIRAWLAQRGRESTASLGWTHTAADDIDEVRPASSIAARWLSDDLKSLGLASGTFPQLR